MCPPFVPRGNKCDPIAGCPLPLCKPPLCVCVYGRHRYYRGRSKRMIKFQVLVTTYEVLMQDYDELSQVAVRYYVRSKRSQVKLSNVGC